MSDLANMDRFSIRTFVPRCTEEINGTPTSVPLMEIPNSILSSTQFPPKALSRLETLPSLILQEINHHLDPVSRCMLALTSKPLALTATTGTWLSRPCFPYELGWKPHIGLRHIQTFDRVAHWKRDPTLWHLYHALANGWIDPDKLRYCERCGKFRPVSNEYWRAYHRKMIRRMFGISANKWRGPEGPISYAVGNWWERGRNLSGKLFYCPPCALDSGREYWGKRDVPRMYCVAAKRKKERRRRSILVGEIRSA